MDFTLWISFVATVTILVLTPGPSVLLVTANSMNDGIQKTIGTILGDLSANILQITLASLGLASIVISSGEIFQTIKWLGVGYLIYMGVKKIISQPNVEKFEIKTRQRNFLKLYSEGFLMSATNPKAIVFFAALFPLFINENLAFLPQVITLTITFIILDGTSLLIYTLFATKLKAYLENKAQIHLQNKIIGGLLIFSGLLLSMVKNTKTE